MKSRLLSRVGKLESYVEAVMPSRLRVGLLRTLPNDYVGPRHVVVLSRTPGALPHIEACEFEERPGRTPSNADDDDVDRIYIVYIDATADQRPRLTLD
jgi:hypothetical protein